MLILFCCVVDNHSFGVLESSPTCQVKLHVCTFDMKFTAISRKVVGKSARDNPERYCG